MCPFGGPGGLGVHDGEHALEMRGGALRAPVLVSFQPQKVLAILAAAVVELQLGNVSCEHVSTFDKQLRQSEPSKWSAQCLSDALHPQ